MKPRVVGTVFSTGLAALLAGALAAVPAPASVKDLHVVASPVISNSSLSGAAVIASNDMWAVGDIGTGSGPFQTLAEHFNGTSWSTGTAPAGASSTPRAASASSPGWPPPAADTCWQSAREPIKAGSSCPTDPPGSARPWLRESAASSRGWLTRPLASPAGLAPCR